MKNLFLALLLLISPLLASDIEGEVKLLSKSTKRKVIRMEADPVCVKQNQGKPVYFEDIVVGKENQLAHVFIYLKEGAKIAPQSPEKPEPVLLDQRGCIYIPHVWGVLVNQPFTILNSDPTLHNVHSLAKLNANFNVGMAVQGQKLEKKFSKPEAMIRIKCDVHPWMGTYVGVMDHPYFFTTNLDGGFRFKNIPPGKYTLVAWHEKLGEKTQAIEVPSEGVLKVPPIAF